MMRDRKYREREGGEELRMQQRAKEKVRQREVEANLRGRVIEKSREIDIEQS